MAINDATNVTTGEVRLSYVHLFQAVANQPGQDPKFSVTILLPKTDQDTLGRINAAIEAAKQAGVADKWGGQLPPVVPTPIHDGDGVRPSDGMAFGQECKGHWVFTASAKEAYPPEVVDKMGNPIIDQSKVYSGVYGRVNIQFYAYNSNGRKGIGCGLGPVQILRDGEPLASGRISAAQAFGQPVAQTSQMAAPQMAAPQAVPQMAAPQAAPQAASPYAGMGYIPQQGVNPITGQPY